MSSSNSVSVRFIEEATYGTTPGAGNFKTARFISESLTGSPETTESAQIRTDRLASGQVVTGLTVGGDLSFELAKEAELDLFLKSAMLNDWTTFVAITVDLEIDATAKTVERSAGTWAGNSVAVGDVLTLGGFVNTENNVQIMVAEIVSTTVIRYVGPEDMVTEVGPAGVTTFEQADKISIGTSKKSFSMEKKFLDLTNKAITYKGMMVNQMNLNISYGEIVNGSFTFVGNSYETVDAALDHITNGRTVDSPATTNSLNGSIDMPFIASAAVGTFDGVDFCIQSVELSLNNNMTPQTCIGESAPVDYSPGTAQIEISLSAYLSDDNWAVLAKKLTQESFALGFMVKNLDGWYGFYLPAVQVSFDDPSSAGANQDIILNMSGVAKVGAAGEKSLYMYKS